MYGGLLEWFILPHCGSFTTCFIFFLQFLLYYWLFESNLGCLTCIGKTELNELPWEMPREDWRQMLRGHSQQAEDAKWGHFTQHEVNQRTVCEFSLHHDWIHGWSFITVHESHLFVVIPCFGRSLGVAWRWLAHMWVWPFHLDEETNGKRRQKQPEVAAAPI